MSLGIRRPTLRRPSRYPPAHPRDPLSTRDRVPKLPGLAVAALGDDDVYVELIADGLHVDPALFPLIARSKPQDRLMLVSDGLSVAGSGAGRARVDGMELDVHPDGRIVLAGTQTLVGGGTALGDAVGNLVSWGSPSRRRRRCHTAPADARPGGPGRRSPPPRAASRA